MNFFDNFKIFIFCALSLIGHMEARSVSHIGDIRIEQTNDGKWICDGIECPADTYRCYVTKSNEKDPAVLVRTNICYTQDNKPLAEKVTTTAADPNSNIRVEVNSYRNGSTSSSSNSSSFGNNSDFDEEKFQKELQEQLQGIHSNLNNQMKDLDANLKEMNKQIQQNLQNQMQQLQENLNNMQNNLAHMFH